MLKGWEARWEWRQKPSPHHFSLCHFQELTTGLMAAYRMPQFKSLCPPHKLLGQARQFDFFVGTQLTTKKVCFSKILTLWQLSKTNLNVYFRWLFCLVNDRCYLHPYLDVFWTLWSTKSGFIFDELILMSLIQIVRL